MRTGMLFSVVLATSVASAQPGAVDLAPGREAALLLLSGDATVLAKRLSPAFLAAVRGPAGFASVVAGIRQSVGAEQAVIEEAAFAEDGLTTYYRRSRFANVADITTSVTIDAAGVVQGALVKPTIVPAASTRLDYRPHARLRLPLAPPPEGRWYVRWGGRDAIRNYHVIAPDQRFASDMLVMKDGLSHRGAGAANADHYCWGVPILAPADGAVVTAVDGVPDNARPGAMNAAAPAGNHVILDLGLSEYAVLAHLRQGSLAVKAGQRVRAGDRLGVCGNSGNSSQPHLHIHLQDQPRFGQGLGLPLIFAREGDVTRGRYLSP